MRQLLVQAPERGLADQLGRQLLLGLVGHHTRREEGRPLLEQLGQVRPKRLEAVAGELNVTWVLVGTVLVFFMQAGFAFLEIGFSRGKNAGMGIAKILVNFSIASVVWWAAGFAIAFGLSLIHI